MKWSDFSKFKQKGGIQGMEQKSALPAEVMKQMIEKFDGIDKGELKLGQAADGSCEDYWWSPVCLTLCAPLSGLPFGLDFTLQAVDCNYDGHCNIPQIYIEGDNVCVVLPGYVFYTVTVGDDLSISCAYAGFYYGL